MAVPMANDPPFATLNHFAADLGIPSESDLLRIGIRSHCGLGGLLTRLGTHVPSMGRSQKGAQRRPSVLMTMRYPCAGGSKNAENFARSRWRALGLCRRCGGRASPQ